MKQIAETHVQLRKEFDFAASEAHVERQPLGLPGAEEPAPGAGDQGITYWHRGPELLEHTGLVFYHPRVVQGISLADTKSITKDDEHVNTVLHVTLREWKKNPGARFYVAVPARYQFSKQPQWGTSGPQWWPHRNDWSKYFQERFVEDVWRFDVRFLTGFFDCNTNTLHHVGEKCGLACGDKPFHVTFSATDGIATHPNYTFALGAHDPQHPVYRTADLVDLNQEAVSMPDWMYPEGHEGSHWQTWFCKFKQVEVPTWGTAPMCEPQSRHTLKDAARRVLRHRENLRLSGKAADDEGEEPPPDPNEKARNEHLENKRKAHLMERDIDPVENSYYLPPPLPNLGKVASKRLKQEHFDKFWAEGIHINFIFVGQSLPSANSRANTLQKWRRNKQQSKQQSRLRQGWRGARGSASARAGHQREAR